VSADGGCGVAELPDDDGLPPPPASLILLILTALVLVGVPPTWTLPAVFDLATSGGEAERKGATGRRSRDSL
jgi:hypothetical protein